MPIRFALPQLAAFPLLAATVAVSGLSPHARAQRVYTAADYASAERWMSYNVAGLSEHSIRSADYLPDGRVFFADPTKAGTIYRIADPAAGTVSVAFGNAKLAAAINASGKAKLTERSLGITSYKPDGVGFTVVTRGGTFHCDAAVTACSSTAKPAPVTPVTTTATPQKPGEVAVAKPAAAARTRRNHVLENDSPDHSYSAFVRSNNLWLRVNATGEERQLTTDGAPDYGYATDNAGWQHSDAAILTWSADSKKIATYQQDQRKTGMMYLVPTTNRHPVLEAWRYPLVGDKDVTLIEPVVIDAETGRVTRLKTEPLQHRSMECDDISCADGRWTDVEFSPDDARLAFVKTSRDHKDETVAMADTETGTVKEIYHEHVPTYYGWQANTDWKVLWSSNEFLWVSERSNYAQVYLYDLNTGALKNAITHGDGPVEDFAFVDQAARVLYFLATAKEPGDAYQRRLYSVSFDGSVQTLLTPEALDHAITAGPEGKTFVDLESAVETPQTAVVRDRSGKVLVTLAKQDISALTAKGWKPPTRFTVKARDGKTDLWGNLWKPTNFDATKKYPLVDYIYPGPQDGSCSVSGPAWFRTSRGDDNQSLADLGFIVICLDGMGNPHRSKAFHDAHASRPEDMGDDTIPDQVAGIKELAAQHSWIDLTRVGIWGHSGGGNATVSAMFHFPEFFKVGWAESGNHDNRDYEDDWDERWAGLEVIGPDGKSNYDAHANQNYAKNLRGKLMLVHGTMDDNVPPSNTLLVTDALMKANKDFDLLMVPNAHHGYGEQSPYIMRRRWDYFVAHLANGTPPQGYTMTSTAEAQRKTQASE